MMHTRHAGPALPTADGGGRSPTAPGPAGPHIRRVRAAHIYFVHTSGDTHAVLRDNGGRHHEHH